MKEKSSDAMAGGLSRATLSSPTNSAAAAARASVGSGARSVIAGHFPSYYVRSVGGLQVARSDDFAFANDLVTLRFTWRVDGALPQTSHIKRFQGGTA
jgi:HK97 family phage major capsid protein